MLRLILRAILWAFFWGIVTPIVAFAALSTGALVNPFCGTPNDAGSCALGVAAATYRASSLGFLLGFLVTLVRGILRRQRAGNGT